MINKWKKKVLGKDKSVILYSKPGYKITIFKSALETDKLKYCVYLEYKKGNFIGTWMDQKYFKTKSEALKFARAYMGKH